MIEGYFDESGDFDEEPKVFCISGYYLVSEAAKEMHEKWGEVLARHNIPYFHMVDCAHGTDAFAGMEKDERTEIVKEFIDLIKKYTLAGVSVIVREEDFEASDKHPDAYSSCVAHCVTALQVFLHVSRIEGDMAYFFESGHKNRGRAFKHVAETLEKLSAPLTFAPKEQVRLLQAADLLAWQSSKYVKDRISKKRPPRKDFMSLMEHPHSFAHVTLKDGGGIGFEDWPISRRSPTSTTLSISCDGPVVFLYEDGEQAPIVAIDRAIGWRMGGGRMAYAKIQDARRQQRASVGI